MAPGQTLAQAGDPEAGRNVFKANCAMCHGADASGMMRVHPSLRGAVERLTLEGVEVTVPQRARHDATNARVRSRLTDQEINDVIALSDTL
jgi:mono/diheme cytochrome c family protein